ncbi:MAG: hypothetical protein H6835_07275 [Planctomycetes bacterium]|nr:hypothetical protein [Planctomycetota bacterium]
MNARRTPFGLFAVVALLAVVAYGAALTGVYVFDDIHSVDANPALHDLGNLGRFWVDPGAFSGAASRMYRPALLTSFALNLWISPAAWSLKAGNVLLHAATAALLCAWLWQLSRRRRAAAVAAALFAVHPLASEAINLVSARSELLTTFGVLVAMCAHVSWQRRRSGGAALAAMLLGAVLAVGSKETGVVLPALLLLQATCLRHRWPDRREWLRTAGAVLPVLAVVGAYLLARKLLLGQATVQLLGRGGEDPLSGYGRSLSTQLATMGTLLPRVLCQAVAPTTLSVNPEVHYTGFDDPFALLGWASLGGLTVAALWRAPSARLTRIGVVLAWAIAAPWIVVPLNMPLAEHRLYGPMVGFAAVLAALSPRLAAAVRRRATPRAMPVACGVLLALGVAGSASRSLDYRDERTLWRQELARNPDDFRAWWGLGATLRREGDVVASVDPLRTAHLLYPAHYDLLRHFTEALVSLPDELARPDEALVVAQRLCAQGPEDPWARTLWVQAELQAGRVLGDPRYFETAGPRALSCLEIAPPKGYVYQLAAAARRGLGDYEGALQLLDASIARGLAPVGVRADRFLTLQGLGRAQEARDELLALQRDFPGDATVFGLVRSLAAPPR